MTRSSYHQWCEAIARIISATTIVDSHDLILMWEAGIPPEVAAAEIYIAEFERTINS